MLLRTAKLLILAWWLVNFLGQAMYAGLDDEGAVQQRSAWVQAGSRSVLRSQMLRKGRCAPTSQSGTGSIIGSGSSSHAKRSYAGGAWIW